VGRRVVTAGSTSPPALEPPDDDPTLASFAGVGAKDLFQVDLYGYRKQRRQRAVRELTDVPPQISPDGGHYWDEQRRDWVPLPTALGQPRSSPFMSGFAGCGGACVFMVILMAIAFAACASIGSGVTHSNNSNGMVTVSQVQS
jgi:hypothetical protein